ncbi:MAG TPA: acetyl-CoA decarbonylase/synthase complex subunit gamma [Desulfotomaculum sp.]|nr:acetyl-CoA decarbonylase/synthase complex subunit gamma [Desulfotomaculum sp.]
MPLTGLDIFKLLPKTNCKKCGQATCLAFAMALANAKADVAQCPDMNDTARDALEAASSPQIALVKIGVGPDEAQAGNETVLFRHDKCFVNPTPLAVLISDRCENPAAEALKANNLVFDRLGQMHGINLLAVQNHSGDPVTFCETVRSVSEKTNFPLILVCEDSLAIEKALEVTGAKKPLVYAANEENYKVMTELARKYNVPLAVKGRDLDHLAGLAEKVAALGHRQLVLDSGAQNVRQVLADQTQIRRQALRRFRPFGYPTIVFAANSRDPLQAVIEAGVYIAKYAGIVVLPSADPEVVLPLVTLRLNIFTDPQKPAAVDSRIYEIGSPGNSAPVLVTSNFSLTYFCVASDVEASRVPAYILPVDTDGVSVLTGWAAGKFTPEKIAAMLKESGIEDKVTHRRVIIPGGVAVLSGKLQDLSGWEVIVGPVESSGLPAFLKRRWVAEKA